MRRFTVLGLRFARALATRLTNRSRADHYIRHLQGDAGPGLQALTPTVNGDEPARDLQLCDVRILPDNDGSEEAGVKGSRPNRIDGPDRVFDFFNGDHLR